MIGTNRHVGVKALLVGCAMFALPHSAAAEDAGLIGFWSFKGGTAGTTVETVADDAGQWAGTAYVASGNAGVKPTYSDVRPGAMIYAGGSVLCSYPRSVHFALATSGYQCGGYIDIAGLSGSLAGRSAFTIEFWARLDDDSVSCWTVPLCLQNDDGRHVTPTLGQGPATHVKFAQLNADDTEINATVQRKTDLLNEWRHVAMVYAETDSSAHSGGLKCYVDYNLVGTLAYTNTAMTGSATALRVGSTISGKANSATHNFRGDICALRVTSAALDTFGMMRAEPDYSVPAGGTLGFWDFKDGEVGSPAATVSGRSDMSVGVVDAAGSKLDGVDFGSVPMYDSDAPGERIFGSSDQSAANVLVREPQSLKFTTEGEGTSVSEDSRSVGGGVLRFPELGSAISAQTNYTVECFFKDEDWSEWQWASGLFGFYSRSGDAVVTNQAMVSSVKTDKSVWDLTIQNANIKYDNGKSWKDGKWHHLALVYNGAASQLKLYVDYKPGGTVAYENGFLENSNFILGSRADCSSSYAFRGKVSCLRVVPVALEPSGFMTSGSAPGLAIFVR